MTAAETFIRDAIEGDWKFRFDVEPVRTYKISEKGIFINRKHFITVHEILLDPEAWQAVGKVRGWKRGTDPETGNEIMMDPSDTFAQEVWLDNMHRMIDALAEGKTIEQYLETL